MRYGRWYAVQHVGSGLSVGLHVEPRTRQAQDGPLYGPYVDLHLGKLIVSFGRNPIYAGALDLLRSYARGGIRG